VWNKILIVCGSLKAFYHRGHRGHRDRAIAEGAYGKATVVSSLDRHDACIGFADNYSAVLRVLCDLCGYMLFANWRSRYYQSRCKKSR